MLKIATGSAVTEGTRHFAGDFKLRHCRVVGASVQTPAKQRARLSKPESRWRYLKRGSPTELSGPNTQSRETAVFWSTRLLRNPRLGPSRSSSIGNPEQKKWQLKDHRRNLSMSLWSSGGKPDGKLISATGAAWLASW